MSNTSYSTKLARKLGGDAAPLADCIRIDLSSYYKDSLAAKIEQLKEAMDGHKLVRFHYYYSKGEADRRVEPYRIVFKWSSWYLFGFCTGRQDFRLFKLNRLWELCVLDTAFAPREIPGEKARLGSHITDDYFVTARSTIPMSNTAWWRNAGRDPSRYRQTAGCIPGGVSAIRRARRCGFGLRRQGRGRGAAEMRDRIRTMAEKSGTGTQGHDILLSGSIRYAVAGGGIVKIEIGESGPDNLKEYWPGQHSVFHRLEYACGIPSVLFAITTRKENGRPNVNFHGWSSFTGDVGGFYAVLPGVQHTSHTYQNVLRTGEFVINFLGKQHYDACIATVSANGGDTDEIAAGGLTEETAAVVDCPRLREAFLSLECRLEQDIRLSENGLSSLLIARVVHAAADEAYADGLDGKYGDEGFMLYAHAPKSLKTGEGKPSAVAVCRVVRTNEEG